MNYRKILKGEGKRTLQEENTIQKPENNKKKIPWNSVISTAKAFHYTTCKPDCKLVLVDW